MRNIIDRLIMIGWRLFSRWRIERFNAENKPLIDEWVRGPGFSIGSGMTDEEHAAWVKWNDIITPKIFALQKKWEMYLQKSRGPE